jgi:hypothetical protein
MLKHEVGIKKRPQILVEIDETYFLENPADLPPKQANELLESITESAA